MAKLSKLINSLETCLGMYCENCDFQDEEYCFNKLLKDTIEHLKAQDRAWKDLKQAITELRDSGGTGTQEDVCRFLWNWMNYMEKERMGYDD